MRPILLIVDRRPTPNISQRSHGGLLRSVQGLDGCSWSNRPWSRSRPDNAAHAGLGFSPGPFFVLPGLWGCCPRRRIWTPCLCRHLIGDGLTDLLPCPIRAMGSKVRRQSSFRHACREHFIGRLTAKQFRIVLGHFVHMLADAGKLLEVMFLCRGVGVRCPLATTFACTTCTRSSAMASGNPMAWGLLEQLRFATAPAHFRVDGRVVFVWPGCCVRDTTAEFVLYFLKNLGITMEVKTVRDALGRERLGLLLYRRLKGVLVQSEGLLLFNQLQLRPMLPHHQRVQPSLELRGPIIESLLVDGPVVQLLLKAGQGPLQPLHPNRFRLAQVVDGLGMISATATTVPTNAHYPAWATTATLDNLATATVSTALLAQGCLAQGEIPVTLELLDTTISLLGGGILRLDLFKGNWHGYTF